MITTHKSRQKLPVDKEPQDILTGVKICCVSTVPFHLVSQLKGQIEYFKDTGMEIILVSSDGPEWDAIKLGSNLNKIIVEISRPIKPWKDIIALIGLFRIFIKYKFDIVHSSTPKAGLLTAIAAFLAGTPIRIHTWTGQPWVTLKGPVRLISRLADRIIGILNTQCYADSKSQCRFLINEKIVKAEKITVINHGSFAGVDLERFNPKKWSSSDKDLLKQELSLPPDSKIVTFIGRITRDKGVLELISAFKNLICLEYDADLLLVGPLDHDCGGTGSIDLTEANKHPKIHYIGYTDCPERYLAISDVFCLPSYREGFGTVVIEAAAMGVPAIGTQINGLSDAIVNGETGILVPPEDDTSLLGALKELLDDPDLLCQMGKTARQRCIEKFDANILNRKITAEYVTLLKKI